MKVNTLSASLFNSRRSPFVPVGSPDLGLPGSDRSLCCSYVHVLDRDIDLMKSKPGLKPDAIDTTWNKLTRICGSFRGKDS
jgi:hypothetical protein